MVRKVAPEHRVERMQSQVVPDGFSRYRECSQNSAPSHGMGFPAAISADAVRPNSGGNTDSGSP